MKRVKVLLGFIKYPVPEKIEFYRNIIACMTGNPNFPEPEIALTLLTTAVTALENNYMASLTGAYQSTAKLHDSEKAADELFRQTALYVDRIAKGSEAIILSSGFEPSHQPNPAYRSIFSVEQGENPGEVILHCKKIQGAKSYLWQHCGGKVPTGDADYILAGASTKASFVISGLTPLVKYWFRVCAITPEGMQAWLEPISFVVK